MSFQEKSLTCIQCGGTFTFSAEDQEFFKTKGYTNEPKRCPTCRQARQSERRQGNGGSFGQRQRYPAVCSQCGKETELPFQPRDNRPVYCSECYNKIKTTGR